MKIASTTVATLFLLITVAMSLNLARFNFRDVEDTPRLAASLERVRGGAAVAVRRDQLAAELDSLAGSLRRGAVAALAAGLLALLTLIGLFAKKWLQYLVPALVAVALLTVPLNPSFERTAPAPPRSLAMVLAALAVVGAAAAFGSDWLRRRHTTNVA